MNWTEQMDYAKALWELAGNTPVQNPVVTMHEININLTSAAHGDFIAFNANYLNFVLQFTAQHFSLSTAATYWQLRQHDHGNSVGLTMFNSKAAPQGVDGEEFVMNEVWSWRLEGFVIGAAGSFFGRGFYLRYDFT